MESLIILQWTPHTQNVPTSWEFVPKRSEQIPALKDHRNAIRRLTNSGSKKINSEPRQTRQDSMVPTSLERDTVLSTSYPSP